MTILSIEKHPYLSLKKHHIRFLNIYNKQIWRLPAILDIFSVRFKSRVHTESLETNLHGSRTCYTLQLLELLFWQLLPDQVNEIQGQQWEKFICICWYHRKDKMYKIRCLRWWRLEKSNKIWRKIAFLPKQDFPSWCR